MRWTSGSRPHSWSQGCSGSSLPPRTRSPGEALGPARTWELDVIPKLTHHAWMRALLPEPPSDYPSAACLPAWTPAPSSSTRSHIQEWKKKKTRERRPTRCCVYCAGMLPAFRQIGGGPTSLANGIRRHPWRGDEGLSHSRSHLSILWRDGRLLAVVGSEKTPACVGTA